jgi:PAS domain S-box-containing protein
VCVPIVAESGPLGALEVYSRRESAFGEADEALLGSLAAQAAIALTNARLLERLRASEERYRFLVENSPDVVFATDAEGRFTLMTETIEAMTGYSVAECMGRHFSLLVDDSTMPMAAAVWSELVTDPTTSRITPLLLRRREGGTVPVEVSSIGTVDGAGRFTGIHGATRDMSVRERLERDLRGQAVELAASEERAHLARELHDSVTQALFSMTLITRTIELLLERDPAAARDKLGALRDLQRDALAEMRSLIFELRPGSLEQDGLVHALRTHAVAVEGRVGLPIRLEADELERLPIEVEEALYRIAQEALHNVVKHAAARQVRIALWRDAGGARLRVEDDGKGFDPAAVPPGHLGLAGMHARAGRVGATLVLASSPGSGTRIDVVVPAPIPSPQAAEPGAVAV